MLDFWKSSSNAIEMEAVVESDADAGEEPLAASLRFDMAKDRAFYAPYIAYVEASWPPGSKPNFRRLLKEQVNYFKGVSPSHSTWK